MKDLRYVFWGTRQEKEFINNLGKGIYGRWSPRVGDLPRHEMLRRYIKAAEKRDDWGDLDKDFIIQHAKESLRSERRG